METIIFERRFDPPIQLDDVLDMYRQATWCMEQYRVLHATSLLSRDGRRLTCVFAAPDAEAVRSVAHQLGVAFERCWPSTVHAPPDFRSNAALTTPEAALVVVERRFGDAVELKALQDVEDRGAWCLEQHRVHFLRSYFALDRRQMLCLYAAPDAESVHVAQRQAGMPFADAWPALVYETSAA